LVGGGLFIRDPSSGDDIHIHSAVEGFTILPLYVLRVTAMLSLQTVFRHKRWVPWAEKVRKIHHQKQPQEKHKIQGHGKRETSTRKGQKSVKKDKERILYQMISRGRGDWEKQRL
jgi:hypothetical protein